MITDDDPVMEFGIAAGFANEQAVLDIQGEVDILSLPVLNAFLDATIASGCLYVVLDMDELSSVDDAGLTIIAKAACRLVALGGQLTIRSSSTEVARILDITWLTGLISLELSRPGQEHLEAPRSTNALGVPARAALGDMLSRQLQDALRSREIIAEAQGMIMERENVDEEGAFDIMRRFSQKSNRPLREWSEEEA